MSNNAPTNEPNLKDMQTAIKKAGGLFYQYRPCRRDVSTIYDIENIRHGVLYAQTPLHMNDPFDSMVGFSAEKIYDNVLSMIVDAFDLDESIKVFIRLLLTHKAFGRMGVLLQSITELKQYLKQKRTCRMTDLFWTMPECFIQNFQKKLKTFLFMKPLFLFQN